MDKKPEAKIASKKIELSTNACTTVLEGWKEPAEVEKDGGRVEKQTKEKLCNGRVGGDVHAASGGMACGMVYRD